MDHSVKEKFRKVVSVRRMATFVLVHGSFRGGWYWQPVARRLRAAGHVVFAPSLAGMGEHSHHASLLAAAGPLPRSVWVNDVASLVHTEDLTDVVLIGHSLGGVIVAEAADQLAPGRVRVLGFLDAPVLRPGQSPGDLYLHDEPRPPKPDPAAWSPPLPVNTDEITDPAIQKWMAERLRPNPVGPGVGPLVIRDVDRFTSLVRRVAFCTRTPSMYPSSRSRVELDATGLAYDVLDAGHDAPVSAPDLVADWMMTL
jgi:pimeloyl-ACP methyl ester carboxylesterase